MSYWYRNELIAENPDDYKKKFPEPFTAMIPEDASAENKLATEGYVDENAGIDSVNVTIDGGTGTPSGEASLEDKTLSLALHNIKGETGATGPQGPQGVQGNTGSSVDYPYELVNNCTTNDATKGLSAAQGVVLDGKISQLSLKVGDTGFEVSMPSFTLSSGYIEKSNGTISASSVNKVSSYIPISGYETIKWLAATTTNSSSTVADGAFYDENGTFISSIPIELSTSVAEKNRESTIPSNATQFRFTCRAEYEADMYVELYKGESVAERLSDLSDIPERMDAVEDKFVGSRKNWIDGYMDADGVVQEDSDYIVTDFIPVSGGDTIEWYNGLSQAEAVYLMTYGFSGETLSNYRRAANLVPIREFTLESINFGFIRATMSATNPNVYIKVNGVTKWVKNNDVDGIEEHPISLLGKNVVIYSRGQYNGWKSGYINNATGAWGSSTVNSNTEFINIKGFKQIRITQSITTNSSNAGICFYKKDRTFILGYAPEVGTEKSYQTKVFDVPTDAYYVRATIYNDQTSHWELVGLSPSEFEIPSFSPMIGAPELYLSGETSATAVSLNSKTSADLYAEYDAFVSAYPQYFKRETDIGSVTYNGNTYEIRAYTLGYNKQTLIDHEPTQNEVISSGDNKWNSDYDPRKILLVSGMHGEEHTPCWGMMLAIGSILSSNEPWAHFIKDNFIFKIVPCVNPAGWSVKMRADSEGHIMNRDEAYDDAESTYYMNWVEANEDAFILIDCHGTQGRYAYLPVMQNMPISRMVYGLANKLASAFFANWQSFYNAVSSGYGTTYAPFLVAKYTGNAAWTRGRYSVRMYQDYGMQSFALETPDDLTTGLIGDNDLRNCKLTKDIVINVLQSVCQLQKLPE